MLLCAAIAGCERNAYHYDYRGTLTRPDGTPAAGVRLSVQPPGGHYADDDPALLAAGAPRGYGAEQLERWAVTTDDRGHFAGRVNHGTYLQWLGCLTAAPAAPALSGVEVWVRRRRASELTPVYVLLLPATQAEALPGGRRLELPPGTVPPGTPAKPTTCASALTWTSRPQARYDACFPREMLMPFVRDEAFASQVGRVYGAYHSTFRSGGGQVIAHLFERDGWLTAHVSFATGYDALSVTDPYRAELVRYAGEHGFGGRLRIVLS